jgi:tetratricopeptide (TPR) repeat protein
MLALAVSLLLPPAGADNLSAYVDLARSGAPELAVRLMERARPEPEQDLVGWMYWEQELIAVLAEWQEWPSILDQLGTLPEGVPPGFEAWADRERARAHTALGEGEAARILLRGLIWESSEPATGDALAGLRRLVIESYLADGAEADARAALLRYQQDYGATEDTRAIRARVLLEAGRFDEVAVVLAEADHGEDLAWRLFAELMSGRITGQQARTAAQEALGQQGMDAPARVRFQMLLAEADRRAGQPRQRILALEQALALAPLEQSAEGPLDPRPDLLWRAYLEHGEDMGNQAQLLLGSDQAWLDMAGELQKAAPPSGRAVYALLVLRSRSGLTREEAARGLVASLSSLGEGSGRIVERLFLDASRFDDIADVPLAVRYRLVDQALVRGDIDLATRLMRGLERPPTDSDPIAWGLRRARVLVLGGHQEEGSLAIAQLIEAVETGEPELIDRILQVVFDLQAVDRHEAAIGHLQALLPRVSDPQQRREILFWMADSHKALEDFQRAAFLYLRSAALYDPQAMDPWGQTARYNAAEALAAGGLTADARRLYEQLLAVTREPARRAVLRQSLQQLWLKE